MATQSGAISTVAGSASSVTLLEINNKRQMASFFNASTQILYINCEGSTATAAADGYTVQVAAGGYFELPICVRGVYTGKITGIWAGANGFVNITEYSEGV